MTKEQIEKLARDFEGASLSEESSGRYYGVIHGLELVSSNPSDFGLITMDEMFEFADFVQSSGNSFDTPQVMYEQFKNNKA